MNYLIIDTETTNGFKNPYVYDVGVLFVDENGNTIESFSFVIEEVFYDADLMAKAYYKDKMPQYWDDIANNEMKVVSFEYARAIIFNNMMKYNINECYAYNAAFDMKALESTCNYICGKSFFPHGSKWKWRCIMGAALSTICQEDDYSSSAERTPSGRVSVSAENVYRYINNEPQFVESHTALEDCKIESNILMNAISYGRDLDTDPKPLQCFKKYWEIQKKAIDSPIEI